MRLTTVWGLATALLLTGVYSSAGGSDRPDDDRAGSARGRLSLSPLGGATPLAGTIAFQMDGIFIGATWSRDMRNMMLLSVLVYLAAWALLTPLWAMTASGLRC